MNKETKKLTGIMMLLGLHYWMSGYFKAGIILAVLASGISYLSEKNGEHLNHLLVSMILYSGGLLMSAYFSRELIQNGFSLMMFLNCWISAGLLHSSKGAPFKSRSLVWMILAGAMMLNDSFFRMIYPKIELSYAGMLLVVANYFLPLLMIVLESGVAFWAKKFHFVKSRSFS